MHLHPGEEQYVSPGHSYVDFEHHGLRIGMAICADTALSSHPLHYAQLQADVYVASVLITEQGYAKDSSLLQQYAKEPQLMVLLTIFVVWVESGRQQEKAAFGQTMGMS